MKLRKLAAIAASAVLVVSSLAACGNDEKDSSKDSGKENQKTEQNDSKPDTDDGKDAESIVEAFKNSSEIKKYTIGADISFKLEGEQLIGELDDEMKNALGIKDSFKFGVSFDGKVDEEASAAEIAGSINFNDKVNTDVLEISAVDGTFYLNVQTVMDAVKEILKVAGEEQGALDMPEGDYFKVTEEMLEELMEKLESTGVLDLEELMASAGSMEGALDEETQKQAEELVTFFGDILMDVLKDSKAYTEGNGTFKLQINNDNINDIVKELSETAVEKSDEIVEKLIPLLGEDAIDAEQIKAMALQFKEVDVNKMLLEAQGIEVDILYELKSKNGSFDQTVSFALGYEGSKVEISVNVEKKADDSVKVKAPTDVMSDEDINTVWDGILGSMDNMNDSDVEKNIEDLFDDVDDDDIDDDDWF